MAFMKLLRGGVIGGNTEDIIWNIFTFFKFKLLTRCCQRLFILYEIKEEAKEVRQCCRASRTGPKPESLVSRPVIRFPYPAHCSLFYASHITMQNQMLYLWQRNLVWIKSPSLTVWHEPFLFSLSWCLKTALVTAPSNKPIVRLPVDRWMNMEHDGMVVEIKNFKLLGRYFYCCTVHFDDSTIFTHQHMHLYHILLNH
jgi:hypothetical protein